MANINDLHLLMGRALEGIENLERGVRGINQRIDDNIQPAIEDYKSTKNKIIGGCAIISTLVGGGIATVFNLFK